MQIAGPSFYSVIPHKSGIFVQVNCSSYSLIDDMKSWKLVWLPAARFVVNISDAGLIITCGLDVLWATTRKKVPDKVVYMHTC